MRSTKIIKICSSSLCTCLHHMVILRNQNKITDFLMILAWASPFKIYGMFKFQLLTFCFDLINKNSPAYFINMSSLLQPVIYHHNIRQKRNYSVARVKHVFAKKCMRFCIPDILNNSSSLITDKIKTHSRKGFLVYLKCFLVNEYNSMCLIPAIYVQKLLVS